MCILYIYKLWQICIIPYRKRSSQELHGAIKKICIFAKSKVKALSSLRKIPTVNEKIYLDSVKLFNRLIIFAQQEMTVEISLQYELTPFPLSQFSNKDHKMNKANKTDFSKTSLKALTDPLDLTNQPCRHPGD